MRLSPPPLSLYIHFPWCVRKCPYCDFNSHPVQGDLPEQQYVEALLLDLTQDLEWMEKERVRYPGPLHSLFLGGGTPSLFSPESIHRLLSGIRALLPWPPDIEITLEANPSTVESSKFRAFRDLGINRLSLGVQSFQEPKLKALGRIHSAREAEAAIETAKEAGFTNLNVDLMFGLPRQSLNDALYDVTTALRHAPTHISFYQLTLEPNTIFAKYPPSLPNEDTVWEIGQTGQEKLELAGFQRYEISAYAQEGYQCQHNLNYWRFGDYLGLGAGAHGKLTDAQRGRIWRYFKIRHPGHYLQKAKTPERIGGRVLIAERERPLEFLLNALRLKEGFSPGQFECCTGLPFSLVEPVLDALLAENLLYQQNGRIACTPLGWNFLDSVLERFIGL